MLILTNKMYVVYIVYIHFGIDVRGLYLYFCNVKNCFLVITIYCVINKEITNNISIIRNCQNVLQRIAFGVSRDCL